MGNGVEGWTMRLSDRQASSACLYLELGLESIDSLSVESMCVPAAGARRHLVAFSWRWGLDSQPATCEVSLLNYLQLCSTICSTLEMSIWGAHLSSVAFILTSSKTAASNNSRKDGTKLDIRRTSWTCFFPQVCAGRQNMHCVILITGDCQISHGKHDGSGVLTLAVGHKMLSVDSQHAPVPWRNHREFDCGLRYGYMLMSQVSTCKGA